ncbi:SDR family oxidoreductase [Pseudomonas sp. TTU2014-080ASC]|uniref:SDR family oxidoreductase n=1 Tax=Pseudomonas sp. TTU2014-080ASC TaxID=1729724 RepID=UPI00071867C8|nr:SDR family oxidoreductase [Pseudomonas sp. TTU2014-080ASC]KRW59833.1 hypothetical protein AO726_13655 [Pseudomonas sp. TTU2014-080ASC]
MQTWLITGATSGLGYATCEQLLAGGNRVIACSRSIERLDDLQQIHGQLLLRKRLNIDEPIAIRSVVSEAFAEVNQIDVVLSSAGYGLFGAVEELHQDQIEAQLRTNLLGSILLLQACLPYLRAQGFGRLLQVSSESGEMSFPALALYQASKWGIEGFCEGLRQEVESLGLHVTLIVPGRVATRFDEHVVKQRQTLSAYQGSTVGNYRRLLAMGKFPSPGCVQKMATAIINCATITQPPRRLILGSDAYKNIQRALSQRLHELEQQRDSAARTDR